MIRRSRGPRDLLPPTLVLLFVLGTLTGCRGGETQAEEVRIQVPRGAPFQDVVDTLEARGLVERTFFFRVWARLRGVDRNIRSGEYAFPGNAGWDHILDNLVEGRVATRPLTVPEGFTLRQIGPRVARITDLPGDSVTRMLADESLARDLGVPGPTLEGYLYPETYRFAAESALPGVVETMVDAYQAFWTSTRRARLDSLEMSERELVTLASIVQAEARITEEMDTIAAVYHNRLERGYLLQADPTVLYALGGTRERLLYAAMDSVADHPYNTYTHGGLPPGPIGSPGEEALDAALWPAESRYLYFVARPDGSHIFSHTLSEHNRAVARARRLRREMEQRRPPGPGSGP